jgi:hypothetical protein
MGAAVVVAVMKHRGLAVLCLVAACTDSDGGTSSTGTVSIGSSDPGTTTGDAESTATTGDESTSSVDPTTATTDGDTTEGGESTGPIPAECGNGVREGDEVCDGEDFGELSCKSLGFDDGELTCSATCSQYETSGCFICGNGMVEGAETCDGSVPQDTTCETEGFTEGTIACDAATCQLDTSGCTLCGDGVAEGNEACDGDDLAGETCASLGLIGGDLACDAASCLYVISGCESFMEDFESGTMGAYWSLTGNANWAVDSNGAISGSFSGRSGLITHNQQTGMSVTLQYAQDSSISFWYATSSESNFDYLRFYIDDVQQGSWSGNNLIPQQATYDVSAGVHTFEWRYTKDGSINGFQDTVWVDDIYAPGGELN